MMFLESLPRGELYRVGGVLLAETAVNLGIPLGTDMVRQWGNTMCRLATADDISETTPEVFHDPLVLVDALDIPTRNRALLSAADGLLRANERSRGADTMSEHLRARADEARFSMHLLKHQTAQAGRYAPAWRQLEHLSVASIYVDSLFDAREDAASLEGFSVGELAIGSFKEGLRSMRAIRPFTYHALRQALRKNNMGLYFAAKPLRALKDMSRLVP